MATIDDYNRQLSILSKLRQDMQDVRVRFELARRTYSDQIVLAGNHKFMGDYIDQLNIRYREFSDFLDRVLMQISRSELEINEQEKRVTRLKFIAEQQT